MKQGGGFSHVTLVQEFCVVCRVGGMDQDSESSSDLYDNF